MNAIQEITSQTAESTEATAHSIGALATMAKEMRTSVEGFKLPGDSAA
jgi:twitching motility protein PilJ